MILIALGANLPSFAGPPPATFDAALAALESAGDIRVLKRSRNYASPAWPDPSQPPFTNAVASLETGLDPKVLLERLHGIEDRFGRVRGPANAPRPLDLDLLDYDGLVRTEAPILPHPRMDRRAFVLLPLSEIAPSWRHPVSGVGIDLLINGLPSALKSATVPV